MKKSTAKLQLKSLTLRTLDASALSKVAGGLSGYWRDCSNSCNTCDQCSVDASWCFCQSLGDYC